MSLDKKSMSRSKSVSSQRSRAKSLKRKRSLRREPDYVSELKQQNSNRMTIPSHGRPLPDFDNPYNFDDELLSQVNT